MITCQGVSAGARLAAEVARELDAEDAASALAELARTGAVRETQEPTVVIDGCASACASRQATARGVQLAAAVNLAELDVSVDEIVYGEHRELAGRIVAYLEHTHDAAPHLPRPKRHDRPAPPRDGRTHTVDDYLLAMDTATSPIVECGMLVTDAPTLASHVSDELGVTRATAGEMLRKLEAEGLVHRGTGKELLLTAEGRAQADAIVRRQRLLEVFAADDLGYGLSECREPARALRDAFDDDAISRLEERLGFPERCPHGCPVDPARARDEARELRVLWSLAPGETACIAWLRESDAATLGALAGHGVRPDVGLRVIEATAAAELRVDVDGNAVVLGEREARAVLVRPLPAAA